MRLGGAAENVCSLRRQGWHLCCWRAGLPTANALPGHLRSCDCTRALDGTCACPCRHLWRLLCCRLPLLQCRPTAPPLDARLAGHHVSELGAADVVHQGEVLDVTHARRLRALQVRQQADRLLVRHHAPVENGGRGEKQVRGGCSIGEWGIEARWWGVSCTFFQDSSTQCEDLIGMIAYTMHPSFPCTGTSSHCFPTNVQMPAPTLPT